jgi:lipopolysaccharide export LptBFGC system permease protein LptF
MRRRGHPIAGAVAGFFFGLFLDLFLVTSTVVSLDSILLTILPFLFLVLGIAWGKAAPLGRPPADADTA